MLTDVTKKNFRDYGGEAAASDCRFCAAISSSKTVWYSALARVRFSFRLSRRNAAVFALGSALLVATAALTWDGTAMDWPTALAAHVVAGAVAVLTLTPQHRARSWALFRGGV